MDIDIQSKLDSWHLQTRTGTIPAQVAVNGSWYCFAQQIFNAIVDGFLYGSVQIHAYNRGKCFVF